METKNKENNPVSSTTGCLQMYGSKYSSKMFNSLEDFYINQNQINANMNEKIDGIQVYVSNSFAKFFRWLLIGVLTVIGTLGLVAANISYKYIEFMGFQKVSNEATKNVGKEIMLEVRELNVKLKDINDNDREFKKQYADDKKEQNRINEKLNDKINGNGESIVKRTK